MTAAAPTLPAATPPPLDGVTMTGSAMLAEKLAGVRRKQVTINVGTGLAMAWALAVALLAVAMLLDWWLNLPWMVRALILLGNAALFGFVCHRYVVKPVVHAPDAEDVALLIEREVPQFRSRLIAAVQLTQPRAIPRGAAAVLVRALVAETEAVAAPLRLTEIVRAEKLLYTAISATLIVLCGLMGFAAGREASRDLLKRAFLSNTPVPRKTRVRLLAGNITIPRGDPVKLAAVAEGIIPSSGRALLKFASGRKQEFTLEPATNNAALFSRTIENVQESFDYVIELYDGRSDAQRVDALPRPTVASIECLQIFPPYTHLPRAKRPLGDLTLLAGSRLLLKMTASTAMSNATLRLSGLNKDAPMMLAAQQPNEARAEVAIPQKGLTGFSVRLLDTHGLTSTNEAVYRVDILPDRAPLVQITYPDRKELLVTPQATLIIGFEASDDFALKSAFLHYKIDQRDSGAEQKMEFDLVGQTPKALRRRHEWKLGEMTPPLPEGSTVEFWIEVRDTNDVTGPGIGQTEHYWVKVVSEAEKRADLMGRLDNYLGTITTVTEDQEKLSQSLGELILQKPAPKF